MMMRADEEQEMTTARAVVKAGRDEVHLNHHDREVAVKVRAGEAVLGPFDEAAVAARDRTDGIWKRPFRFQFE